MSSTLASVSVRMRDAHGRFVQPGEEPIVAAFAAPHREQVGQARLIGDVGVAIERDVDTAAPRPGNPRKHLVELVPVARPLRLQVRDLQRAARTPRHRNRLVDGIEQPVVFVAHVRRVGELSRRQRTADRRQLIDGGERAGCVLESGRGAAGAFGERALHERGHALQFLRGCRSIAVADHESAHGTEADHRCDIHRGLTRFDAREQRRERSIGATRRARRAVLTRNDGRDALPHHRLGAGIFAERAVRM